MRSGPKKAPSNKLTAKERQRIIDLLNSEEYCDLPPSQIVPRLADKGLFLASESTMYRILRELKLQKDRGRAKPPKKRNKPKALIVRRPNQVWSWDITYVLASLKGTFHYVYMIMDVFSRKIVGYAVHDEETSENAAALISKAYEKEKVKVGQLTLHSDNGAPMKGSTMLAMLRTLGVASSFSRPSVSNDNPYSESLFRTVKYRPVYPSQAFATLQKVEEWFTAFVQWYNEEHRHSGIKYVTPAQRHRREDAAILNSRKRVYAKARKANPERWSGKTRNWSLIKEVNLNPSLDNKNPRKGAA